MSPNAIDDQPLVILSKSALDPESRNPALSLLQAARFGQVAKLDGSDGSLVDGVRFRAMKGSAAVADSLIRRRQQPTAFLLGSDVLAEAALIARSKGVRANIERVLTLGIGQCRLRILAPNEDPVLSPIDLKRRQIFSKYPMITRLALRTLLGEDASVFATEGADTRVCEWREEASVAAYEIVESGRTARANNLQIVEEGFPYPSGAQMQVPFFDPHRITTDLYVSNLEALQGKAREQLLEFALALESVRKANEYVMFHFHVPTVRCEEFLHLGMGKPSEQSLLGRPGWSALAIAVPEAQEKMIYRMLLDAKAEAIVKTDGSALLSRDDSEVYRAFAQPTAPIEVRSRPDVTAPVARVLQRTDQIRRSSAERPESGTASSLAKGTRYCADAFVTELIELQEAINREAEDDAITEASQSLDWFLLTLHSAQIELADVLRQFADELGIDLAPAELPEQFAQLLTALSTGRPINFDTVYDIGRRLSFQAVAFNSVARKSADPIEKAQSAARTLLEWLKLLEVARLRLDDVIAKL